jgi:hypothetical protein
VSINNKLTVFTATLAIATPMLVSAAEAKSKTKTHPRHIVQRSVGCPVRRVAGGDLADCHGWRLFNGTWDSTCFNLDYLPSQFACSSRGGHG